MPLVLNDDLYLERKCGNTIMHGIDTLTHFIVHKKYPSCRHYNDVVDMTRQDFVDYLLRHMGTHGRFIDDNSVFFIGTCEPKVFEHYVRNYLIVTMEDQLIQWHNQKITVFVD
jgi:hypothetical protein